MGTVLINWIRCGAEGICLGHKMLSGESIVGNKDGVFKTRTVRRVPLEEIWQFDLLQSLGGVPWECDPAADEAEQVVQDDTPPVPSAAPTAPIEAPHAVFKEEAPRQKYVKTEVLKQIGYTPGCAGCRALQEGRAGVDHSDHCRKRAVETMDETIVGKERLTAARKREDEFLALADQQSDDVASKNRKVENSTAVVFIPVLAKVDSGSILCYTRMFP